MEIFGRRNTDSTNKDSTKQGKSFLQHSAEAIGGPVYKVAGTFMRVVSGKEEGPEQGTVEGGNLGTVEEVAPGISRWMEAAKGLNYGIAKHKFTIKEEDKAKEIDSQREKREARKKSIYDGIDSLLKNTIVVDKNTLNQFFETINLSETMREKFEDFWDSTEEEKDYNKRKEKFLESVKNFLFTVDSTGKSPADQIHLLEYKSHPNARIRKRRRNEKVAKKESIEQNNGVGPKNIYDFIQEIDCSNMNEGQIRDKLLNLFSEKHYDINDNNNRSNMHIECYNYIKEQLKKNRDEDDDENRRAIIMCYAIICDIKISSAKDMDEFIKTVESDGKSGKYAKEYKKFLVDLGEYYEDVIEEVAIQSLIERYYAANAVAETRGFYESDFINFAISATDGQTQSGLQVASNIDNVDSKLNHYEFNNSNRSEHEEAALRYSAFDITFKNTFILSNPIIEKLAAQQIDLRADLFSYGIYNQDDNYFNKDARDKYVTEKLQPIGFTPEEINELLRSMEQLPAEVEKNYKILSGNFDADHDSFEKIAKIYALGEVIDNIKKLFTRSESLSDNQKLSNLMGFKLDEDKPADVVGDYLLLNGAVNGTKTKIKYDLRTGKLYMNALTQQEFNPPKITIGNDEPNTEIGDIGDFEDLLEGYQPTCFLEIDDENHNHNENYEHNASYGTDDIQDNTSPDNQNHDSPDDKNLNQKVLEKLVEDKLLEKLAIIGKTVQEKAGEQSKENVVIDEFLKTFNILPDDGNPGTIEFLGGSNLFILLESIKNTNDEDYLLKFSSLMSELMSFCGLTRGKNNLTSKEHGFDSITIFDIDEKNATQDIISLQRANKSFFSDTDGEKDKIKGCEAHFDSSVQLSFANIIVQKCCRRYGDGRKISANLAEDFVNQIQDGIKKVKHDEDDLIAINNIIDDDSTWA